MGLTGFIYEMDKIGGLISDTYSKGQQKREEEHGKSCYHDKASSLNKPHFITSLLSLSPYLCWVESACLCVFFVTHLSADTFSIIIAKLASKVQE